MSKADRRRHRKKRKSEKAVDLPKLAPTPRPKLRGSYRMTELKADPDALRDALDARCRIKGDEPTADNRRALSGQHSGSELGWCLDAIHDADTRQRLWDVFTAYSAARRAYQAHVLGIFPHAKCMGIDYAREFETDQHHTIDARSQDEKISDARSAMARWNSLTDQLALAHHAALAFAYTGGGPVLWRDNAPTQYGRVTVEALESVADLARAISAR